MTNPYAAVPVEVLIEHAEWARRLARALTGHYEDAADLLQETWAEVLRHPPDDRGPLKPWLATVLRRARRRFASRDTARRARETNAALAEEAPASAEDLLLRFEQHKQLAALVTHLPESYRTVVLLRFYEGRTSSEIAAVIGEPAGTVRWRLKKALDQLREQLAKKNGSDWRRAILVVGGVRPRRLALGTPSRLPRWMVSAMPGLAAIGVIVIAIWARSSRVAPGNEHRTRNTGDLIREKDVPAVPQFVFPPTAALGGIDGVVVDEHGGPVANAVVTTSFRIVGNGGFDRLLGSARLSNTRTDSTGRFRFDELRPGILTVTATAPRFMAGRVDSVLLKPGERVGDIRIVLKSGGVRLYGTVVDTGGGAIGAAQVAAILFTPPGSSAQSDTGSWALMGALTTSDGQYELWLEPKAYLLRAVADGYAAEVDHLDLKIETRRDFRLHPAARITGRVIRKENDEPVADAEVEISGQQAFYWNPIPKPKTDTHGRFTTVGIDPGRYNVTATKGTLVGKLADPVAVGIASAADVTIRISEGLSISGRVTDQNGNALSKAKVTVRTERFKFRPNDPSAMTDSNGKYRVTGLFPGANIAIATAMKHADSALNVVLAEASATDVDFRLSKESRIFGLVVNDQKQPIAGAFAWVQLGVWDDPKMISRASEGATGPDGRFVIDRLPAGRAELSVNVPEQHGTQEIFDLGPGEDKEVTIRIGKQSRISGRVSFDDGTPAAHVNVAAFAKNFGNRTTTGPDGTFAIDKLKAGSVTVHAQSSDKLLFERRPYHRSIKQVALSEGQHLTGVDLVLHKTDKSISGLVQDPSGEGAGGIQVGVIDNIDGRAGWSTCDQVVGQKRLTELDGTFRIDDLSEGYYGICARHPEYPDIMKLSVPSPSSGLILRFDQSGAISGVVSDSAGKPVPAYQLFVLLQREMDVAPGFSPLKGRPYANKTVTDPAGAFRVSGLGKGTYVLLAITPEYTRGTAPGVEVSPGKETSGIRIPIQVGVAITGRIVAAEDGRPLKVMVRSMYDSFGAAWPPRGPSETDAAGRFRIENAIPGTQHTLLFAPDPASKMESDGIEVWLPAEAREFDVGVVKLVRARDNSSELQTSEPGVGLNVGPRGGHARVTGIIPDGPGVASGIKRDDIILSIDGVSTADLGSAAIRQRLEGEEGSRVVLSVQTGDAAPRDVTIVRERY
jgi:RNA polymerase sigma factor (sigma-70 family)